MNKVYKIVWKREVYFSGEIVINDELDPRIHADAHARTGELAGRCSGAVKIESVEEEVLSLREENTCSRCGEDVTEEWEYQRWEYQRDPFVCKKCKAVAL